jgi:antitoxin (DNA-binding transcriptional repressor) of toxin-antitoxin stability system
MNDRISESDIPVDRISPVPKFNSPRVPGQDKDTIIISPDFDDPLPADILDEFYNSSVFPS